MTKTQTEYEAMIERRARAICRYRAAHGDALGPPLTGSGLDQYVEASWRYWRVMAALEKLADLKAEKDSAYEERNQVVAALARLFPSGIKRTDIPGWDAEWHGCVYIDLPTGQCSWHYHDSQARLFDGLPPYEGEWDGHDTPEKYRRVAALSASPATGAKNAQIGDVVEAADG